MMASAKRVSTEAYEDLCRLIQHWNENRLELFEISMPNENLEYGGIMRFYFQNGSSSKVTDSEKVATKCIRVSNLQTTEVVIKSLVQKFRPDMRMLTSQSYALYEVHSNHEERKLDSNENPLLVQLGWSRDDRDGRFLLRSELDPKSQKSEKKPQKKRLSRRVKKSKKEKPEPEGNKDEEDGVANGNSSGRIARSLYNMMPESRFTRSISVKNRRNLLLRHSPEKLIRKDNIGNEFKVHADFILSDVPSITVIISEKDTSSQVVKNALERYGVREDATRYCLVQVTIPSFGSEPHLNVDFNERLLGDNEHPCQVYSDWANSAHRGTTAQFQLRRRSTFLRNQRDSRSRSISPEDDPSVPALVEIFQGAQSPPQSPRRFELSLEMTEIGSNVALLDKSYICLTSSGIKPRHCVISSLNGIFTISPLDKTALIYVNGKYIKEPAFLPHNAELKLGDREMFRFFAPVEGKQFTSSMHTLPSNLGRPGSSRGMTSPARHERKSSLPRTDISKAYSVEDICSPGFTSGWRLKDRAFSEHNLKVDDWSSSGYGSGRVQRKFSEPNFMAEDGAYLAGTRSKYGGSDSHFSTFPSSSKKRHMTAPATVDKGHHDEGVELDWVPPASLSFYQAQENLLLQIMIAEVNGYLLTFKLAPACALYMVLKHHLSPDFQITSSSERRKCLSLTIKNIIVQFRKCIKESRNIAGALAFWMANTSEFLNLLSKDPQLSAYSSEFEAPLSQIIHTAFKYFTSCMTRELGMFLPAFYDESKEADSEEGYISGGESTNSGGTGKESDMTSLNRSPLSRQTSLTGMYWSVAGSKVRRRGRPTMGDILTTLSSTVSLLKRCRVNSTLSVVIFSQLFRYVSAKLFNKFIGDSKLCTKATGQKMKRRLDRVREWAEKEGMELTADSYFSMITQGLNLVLSVKKLPEDAQHVFSSCSKLNSHQVSTLLHHCSVAEPEHTINQSFAEKLIRLSQLHVDETCRNEDIEISVEEDPNPDPGFVIAQRGYFTDSLRGVPTGLHDYLEPMISSGLCKLTIASTEDNPQGVWMPPEGDKMMSPTYSGNMSNLHSSSAHTSKTLPTNFQPPNRIAAVPTSMQDLVIHVNIMKENHSLGISIIGGKNSTMHGDIGIFVKSMVEGGAAHVDGRIQPGDQILAVDNFNLEGCTQEEAAQILRGTGKMVNLTVAKQTVALYGLTHLIGSPSPRYNRKLDRISEGSPQARKAARKQRREQRERQHQERQQRDFRLERRKPPQDRPPHGHTQDLYPGPVYSHHNPDSRMAPHANPQFAKWIAEQNPMYYSDLGTRTESELDLQTSMSSLANIPERDHPVNASEMNYLESSNRYNYDGSERGLYRPSTPPVRDSSPAKLLESSTYMNFGGSSLAIDSSRPNSEGPSKFAELTRVDSENRPPPTPKSKTALPYKDDFSSINSQIAVESQPMLTPFSQQQISSQQQTGHLDRLSMDVMQHTQLSGTSFQGITSLIPRISHNQQPGSKTSEGHLDRKGLKEFEMDDIALEKQRIQLMFFEQQKQKELLELQHNGESGKVIDPISEDEEEDEIQDEDLPQEQLRQELESLEEMISVQRKKYRDLKFSREREELEMKNIEMKFREQEMTSGAFVLSSGDQKRWQSDQKRLLGKLDQLKNEQKELIQSIQHSERRAKTKLKAYEAQAIELRQQLHISTPPAPSPSLAPKTGYESYDTVPSKLTSEYSKKSKNYQDVHPGMHGPSRERSHSSAASEMKWTDVPPATRIFGGVPSRAMSIESMSGAIFEPPDLAKEPLNTISASCLTEPEPTQDGPPLGNWGGFGRKNVRESPLSTDFRPVPTPVQEETFAMEQSGRLNGFRAMSMDNLEGSQSVPISSNSVGRSNVIPIRRGSSFQTAVQPNQHTEGTSSSPVKAPIYAIPEFRETAQPTYDVPTSAVRPPQQQTKFLQAQPTNMAPGGRHYSRNSRARGVQYTKVFLQPTSGSTFNDTAHKADLPKPDDNPTLTPDVVPTSYNPPHGMTNLVAERNQSPGFRGSPLVPSPQPFPHYSVPIPTNIDRTNTPSNAASPTPQLANLRAQHNLNATSPTPQLANVRAQTGNELALLQQQHVQAMQQQNRPALEGAASGNNSPTVYDQPKVHSAPSPRPHSASSSRSGPVSVYDVPTPARKPNQRSSPYEGVSTRPGDPKSNRSSPYEGVTTRQTEHSAVLQSTQGPMNRTNPVAARPKPNTGHRYGIVKPGMGHSYSRSRPDPVQQPPVGLDKVKGYMDRAYKNPGPRHPPERIQRQQTEL